ncbi:hypothetical protein LJB77_01260, partial [Ruminococcaceae bacterium OttesenSCG-928-N02]|nr:hypothetical protein [Ruminococcaceae bacterium OttesenSCG-928-N02]
MLHVFIGIFPYAKPSAVGNVVYSQDYVWSVGNAAAVRFGAPLRDIRVAGGILNYHFFTDALTGILAQFSGQSAWDVATYFSWPIWMLLLTMALYALSRGFGTGPFTSFLLPVGVLLLHTGWEASTLHMFLNMNGVVQSNFYLACSILVLQHADREKFKNKKTLFALVAILAALLWAKSTVGLLLMCALVAAFFVDGLRNFIAHKKENRENVSVFKWPLAAVSLCGMLIFALLWFFIYRNAINNLIFSPAFSQLIDAFNILLRWCTLALALYLFSLYFSLRNFNQLSIAALVVNAFVPGGIVAYALFNHYSYSQSYFLLTAVFAMWLCAAMVAQKLFAKKNMRAPVCLLFLVSFLFTLYTTAPILRTGVQTALRCANLRPHFPVQAQSITPADEQAAQWLHDNLCDDDVFATNRNARDPAAADGIFHYYSAVSERQGYVESWRYAMDYSLEYHLLRHNLEEISDGIFAAQTFEEAASIARENSIRALLVHLPSGGHAYPDAQPAFS